MTQRIVVYSGSSDLLDHLRQVSPGLSFTDTADEGDCRIAVIDSDSHAARDATTSDVRIVLGPPKPADRRSGELCIDRDAFLASADDHLRFAADLADAVDRAEHLEQEVGHFSEIHELMTMVDAEAVSGRITRTVLALLGLDRGTLFIHDPRPERYVVSFSNDDEFRETGEFLPGIPPAVLQEALASPTRFAFTRDERGEGVLVIPLQAGEDVLAVMRVPLSNGDVITAEAAAKVTRYLAAVAQVLSNIYQLTRSRDLALRDDLTKAYNRRFFETYLDEEIERARRYGSIFTIIFLDLDELRAVNERHGHLAGSRTLQEVAKRILGAVRGIDKVVRFGGDEFCIILPQTDQDQAVAVANRVRRALSSSSLQIDASTDVMVTASFGVASFPTHATTKDGLIREADGAMYKVKATGKNAVGVANVTLAERPVTL